MVVGLGTDLIEIARVEKSLTRFGQHILDRVFTPGEIAYCQRKRHNAAESFAARFAAKEAAAKALGTGISRGVAWREIEVVRLLGEPPRLLFSGRAAVRARALGVTHSSLSLTHGREVAMAVVMLEENSETLP